jgi:hypothetical protein
MYSIFLKKGIIRRFSSTFLLCLPVSDDDRIQNFVNEYVNTNYIMNREKYE